MDFNFLSPVSDVVLAHNALLPKQTLGQTIKIHTTKSLPSLENAKLAIIGVKESRNAFFKRQEELDVNSIRQELYKLFIGNWDAPIVDLGDVVDGNTVEDTYFAVKELVAYLVKNNIIPLVIGASQDITYATYRAFDELEQMVNLVAVDHRFDFGEADELISSHSYISKIITEQPANLFNFTNIGYQTYYNAQEEIDLMERLFFESYRLGEIIGNIKLAEPVLRDADVVSIDARSIKASDLGHPNNAMPNGFDSREICAIARYAGISDKVSVFGIYECENTNASAQLIAQILWYFIEGYNYRANEYPFTNKEHLTKFIVPIEDQDLIFYKSIKTERWWIELPTILPLYNKLNSPALLPCSHQDYLDACNQIIPNRWWKAYKKSLN